MKNLHRAMFRGVACPVVVAWTTLVVSTASAQTLTPGPEFQVNTFFTGEQSYPSAASAPDGRFMVVWQSDGQDGVGTAGGGGSTGVIARAYDGAGNAVTGDLLVNTFSLSTQGEPDVAWIGGGNFVVVWTSVNQEGSLTNGGIFGQRMSAAGSPVGTEFPINSFTANNQNVPVVTGDGKGGFVVVWQSNLQDGAGLGVFAQRFASTSAKAGTEFRVNTYTTSSQGDPAVAADASGNFVVVWKSVNQTAALSSGDIYGQRFDSTGARVGTEFRANTETVSGQDTPSVAMDANGNFIVAWESNLQDGSSKGVYAQRYASSGAKIGTEFRVNTFTALAQDDVSVSSTPTGEFVVTWESADQDGDPIGTGLFGQRFDRNGAAVGTEFQVNSYTTYAQADPSVAMDSTGNFVVAWHSAPPAGLIGQDTSDGGIFARRFEVPAPPALRGDCNATGAVDAGDPICTVLCLLGSAPAGADCAVAADCNCTGATDAGDPVCTVLRLIGAFSPDPCVAP